MEISESDQLRAMEKEIASAADFIVHLIRTQRNLPLNPGQVMLFRSSLMDALRKKFLHHWFVDEPTRGSAFRCLQIHKCMDPVLMDAAAASGLNLHALRQILPRQFFMWIDPGEVSYRFGENGSICVLYDARMIPARNDNQASDTSEENVRLQDENVSNNNPASFSKRDEGLVSYNSVNLEVLGSCKESLRQVDNLFDQRGGSNFEQVPPYVSS